MYKILEMYFILILHITDGTSKLLYCNVGCFAMDPLDAKARCHVVGKFFAISNNRWDFAVFTEYEHTMLVFIFERIG